MKLPLVVGIVALIAVLGVVFALISVRSKKLLLKA